MPKKKRKPYRLVYKPEVCARVGVTYVAIWRWIKQGKFPPPRRIGSGFSTKIAWFDYEIDEWIENLPIKGELNEKP